MRYGNPTREMGKTTFRILKTLLFVSLIVIGIDAARTSPTNAQSSTQYPAYWQYIAPDRIDAIYEIDIEQDGASEFAVVAN